MSRIANKSIMIPNNVKCEIKNNIISVMSNKAKLDLKIANDLQIQQDSNELKVIYETEENKKLKAPDYRKIVAMAGTTRALLNNMVTGVSQGFIRKLLLVGVGYKAKLQNDKIVLSLGFSHDVNFQLPEGVNVKLNSPTEIELSGCDKCLVGQTAATIRAFRPPEPYKGKGVRYSNEKIILKETKKK